MSSNVSDDILKQDEESQHSGRSGSIDGEDEWGNQVTKEIKSLSFANPGKFMDNFDPERSTREMRKMNRRIYTQNARKNTLYDEEGKLLENGHDLCDCLDLTCPGCHFPCMKCGSRKCGVECRCNRRWYYEHVEVEGTNLILKWR